MPLFFYFKKYLIYALTYTSQSANICIDGHEKKIKKRGLKEKE